MPKVASPSIHLVPFDGTFSIANAPTSPPNGAPQKKKECEELMAEHVAEISKAQEKLFADDRYSLLLVFQAMDAAGKDGTIRAALTGVNPAGCQVFCFKAPSAEELDHDFLWRTARALPERGRIGVFNRSYYEEVLAVRVHPELLKREKLPGTIDPNVIWEERFETIRTHEQHLARNGTMILKFFLHVSKDEQKKRLLDRLEEPKSNWKFSTNDLAEREHWDEYMRCYEEALRATSRAWAPWYAIPADEKPYMRLAVCELIRDKLLSLNLEFPRVTKGQRDQLDEIRKRLESEG
jgi:PPK2 family polyphosphate:nucleotide phosphotransferase